MSFKPCSVHGHKIAGKLATVISAWFTADGSRTAWKQRLCPDCYREELSQCLSSALAESSDVTACPACGSDSSGDLDPIYLNVYLPKRDPMEFQLATCGACAAHLRLQLQRGAERMANRQQEPSGGDEWDAA